MLLLWVLENVQYSSAAECQEDMQAVKIGIVRHCERGTEQRRAYLMGCLALP